MTEAAEEVAIAGAIIAGGEARRMGGRRKFLEHVAGQPILDHVITRAGPQCAPLLFNAATLPAGYALPLVPDRWPGEGPLGGILSCLLHCQEHEAAITHLLSLSADTPFFPPDLARRLAGVALDGPVSAASGGRRHAVFTLWPVAAAAALERLFHDGERSVNRALDGLCGKTATFPASPIDPFFNINTPDDLVAANRLATQGWAKRR
jgi:molybdopterin-guanine dinucleotide biosynthesis protein A